MLHNNDFVCIILPAEIFFSIIHSHCFFPLILNFNSQIRDVTAPREQNTWISHHEAFNQSLISCGPYPPTEYRMFTTSTIYFGDLMFGLVDVAMPWKPYAQTSRNLHAANFTEYISDLHWRMTLRETNGECTGSIWDFTQKNMDWNVPPTSWNGCWRLVALTTTSLVQSFF